MLTLRISYRKSISFANRLNVRLSHFKKKLDYANQKRFGDRRQRIKSKAKPVDSDRNKEKDDYDGTDDTLRTDSVGHIQSPEVKEPSGKGRDLSNHPDGYKMMGVAGEAIEHPSDLTRGSRSHH